MLAQVFTATFRTTDIALRDTIENGTRVIVVDRGVDARNGLYDGATAGETSEDAFRLHITIVATIAVVHRIGETGSH